MFPKIKNNFIKGYIQVEIEGFYIERFFNICAKEGIKLWGTRRKNSTSVITNIDLENFKKIRKIIGVVITEICRYDFYGIICRPKHPASFFHLYGYKIIDRRRMHLFFE